MNGTSLRGAAAVSTLCVATVLVYLLPQITARAADWPGVLHHTYDELYYDAVLTSAARTGSVRHDLSAGADPSVPSVLPTPMLAAASLVVGFAGANIDAGGILLRALQAVGLALGIVLVGKALGASWVLASAFAAVALFDPQAPYYKVGFGLPYALIGNASPDPFFGLGWSRVVSPAWFSLPGLLTVAALTGVVRRPEPRYAVLAAVLAGWTSYSTTFVAAPIAVATAVTGVLLWRGKQGRSAATLIVVAGLIAAPAAVQFIATLSSPQFDAVTLRNGAKLMANPESLTHAGMWLAAVATVFVIWKLDGPFVPAAAAMATGWALATQSVITQREFQDFHFHYFPPMIWPAFLAGAATALAGRVRIPESRHTLLKTAAVLYLAAITTLGAAVQIRAGRNAMQTEQTAFSRSVETLTWLAANTTTADVVHSPIELSPLIAWRTPARPTVEQNAIVTFESDSVIFGRWAFLWQSQKLDRARARERVRRYTPTTIPIWHLGLPTENTRAVLQHGDYRPEDISPLVEAWLDAYENTRADPPAVPTFAVVGPGLDLDYTVLGWAAADTAFASERDSLIVLRAAEPREH